MLINLLSHRKKEIFFIILLIIFYYRSPHIFLNGRFMAEEGSVYFANAYKFSFLYSLFFVDFNSGYLNLWANISGIISNFFSLRLAPLISNYTALIPKIFIIYFILYRDSLLFKKFEYKILFCLIIFLSPQNVPEIWMNSINSQIFFCILTFLIIFDPYRNSKINYLNLIIIFLAGLTGIYACILTPVYFFKYLIFKTRQDFINFGVIFCCTIIQLSLIFYSKISNLIYSEKIHAVNFDIFINYIYNVVVKVFLGTSFTKYIYLNYLNLDLNLIVIIISFIFLLLIFITYSLFKKNRILNVENNFLIISTFYCFISTSFAVMTGAVAEYVGGRYAVLPSFYLLSILLIAYMTLNKFNIKFFFLFLITFSILSGAYEFRPPTNNVKHQYLKYLDCINCPNWDAEVDKFEKNINYGLKIWPYPHKKMFLN